MLRTVCRGQKGKILRQYIIKSPFISLFCNEGRRQCCCYFFSLFVENVATSKKQEKNCSRISFSFITIFMARWGLVLSKPRIHENWKDCFWFGKISKSYEGHIIQFPYIVLSFDEISLIHFRFRQHYFARLKVPSRYALYVCSNL
jgi:hypothetical protein